MYGNQYINVNINHTKVIITLVIFIFSATVLGGSGKQDQKSLLQLLENTAYVDADVIANIRYKYSDFIDFTDQSKFQESLTHGDELIEFGKIVGMVTVSAVTYGFFYYLIATQIDFGFFSNPQVSSLAVHMRDSYPFISDSKSPALFAILLGWLHNWWVGLPIGCLSALAARLNFNSLQVTWKDLIYPTVAIMSTSLAISLTEGGTTYFFSRDSIRTVGIMQIAIYSLSFLTAITLPAVTYYLRPKETTAIRVQCIGFIEDIMKLFRNHPENPDVQELVRFHLNSPLGNCKFSRHNNQLIP